FAFHAAGRLHRAGDARHGRGEHLQVRDARYLYVAELAESPTGIVVDALLRIAGGPVLVIQQRIGDAAVGLIHADHVAPGRKGARLGLRLLVRLLRSIFAGRVARAAASTTAAARLFARHHDSEGLAGARDFATLILQHAQQI